MLVSSIGIEFWVWAKDTQDKDYSSNYYTNIIQNNETYHTFRKILVNFNLSFKSMFPCKYSCNNGRSINFTNFEI